MTGRCDVEQLEGFLLGELQPLDSARVRAHLELCRPCAGELQVLRREHAAFASRARSDHAPLPDFDAVYAGARAHRPRWTARLVPASIAGAMGVAAAVLFMVAAPVPRAVPVARLEGGAACFPSDGDFSGSVELAQASEDSRFGACLLASPAPFDGCF